MHNPEKRLRQLRRVMLIIELLAPLRRGATAEELAQDVSEDLGPVSSRTIARDLESLELLGLVEGRRPESNGQRGILAKRWHWVSRSLRAAIHRHASEFIAERELVA